MEQVTMQSTGDALTQLGSVGGLIGITTAATHIGKSMFKAWPVPPMAFVFGQLVTIAVWQAGFLKLTGLDAATADVWDWLIVCMWGLTVVLGAMGASTVVDQPKATIKRGTE